MTDKNTDRPIVFFDGVCNLCNQFVDFVIRHDDSDLFQFASLQGQTAAQLLGPMAGSNLESVVLLHRGQTFSKFQAVRQIFLNLPHPWRFFGFLLLLVPSFAGNPAYGLVARHRYRIFGQRETCRLPTPEEKARFLD